MKSLLFLLVLIIILPLRLHAQDVPYHTDNQAIYDFIDELANGGIVEVNTAIKPYSRMTIARLLKEADGHIRLTKRQQQEVTFYLKDFNKELLTGKDFNKRFDVFYYTDSLFKLSFNGIMGAQAWHNGENMEYHRWNGAEVFGYLGKHIAFYTSLRDNFESTVMGGHNILTRQRGAIYKGDYEEQDFSEARGGITYSWKWGSAGVVKDHFEWGSNYNGSNVFSGHTPSFSQFKLHVKPTKWLEMNYVHGWLVSEVIDSTRSYEFYDGTREVYVNKYLAANIFTIKPLKKLNVSFGNSIVYSDVNINPGFVIPILFYKSVDHTYNSNSNRVGHNSQMFFDISSRQIRNTHLYVSLFIDEISLNRMRDKDNQSNHVSIKAGGRITNLLPNTSFTAEFTRTNPFVYTHFLPTAGFESNHYTMGHYLRDNSDELFLSARWKPLRGLDVQVSFISQRRGDDYQTIINNGDEEDYPELLVGDELRRGVPFMKAVKMKRQSIDLRASYQIINDGYIFLQAQNNQISGDMKEIYLPELLLNGENVLSFGVNFGF
jgi:hypothetical protein